MGAAIDNELVELAKKPGYGHILSDQVHVVNQLAKWFLVKAADVLAKILKTLDSH